jgi:hypothetical protein
MPYSPHTVLGTITELWRYPIKSMQGEPLRSAQLGPRGILGDRAYALVEQPSGRIVSAKHPRKWSALLACRASFVTEPQPDAPLPSLAITLPDGTVLTSDDPDVDAHLSKLLGHAVKLVAGAPAEPIRETDRTPIDAAPGDAVIRVEPMALAAPAGTLFDYAPLHLLTTATLQQFAAHYPSGDFAVARFRPNIVIIPSDERTGFVENTWIGRSLLLGIDVHLQVIDPCPRCVVTTLAQDALPRDPGILRTVTQHNVAASATLAPGIMFSAVAGVYAQAQQGGVIALGDAVYLREG